MGTRHGGELVLARYTGPREAFSRLEGVRVIEAHCGHQCWLSPQGDAFLKGSKGLLTVCMMCANTNQELPVYSVPGSIDAIAAVAEFEHGPDAAARVRAAGRSFFPTYPGDKQPRSDTP